MKMKGRAPFRIRASTSVQTFGAVSVLVFGALSIIFFADYVMEFNNQPEMFLWRLISFTGLSMFAGFLASIYHARRTHRWRIENHALHLMHWQEISGTYHNVIFRVYTRDNGQAQLKAILPSGDDAVLARGTCEDMLKVCHYAKSSMHKNRRSP